MIIDLEFATKRFLEQGKYINVLELQQRLSGPKLTDERFMQVYNSAMKMFEYWRDKRTELEIQGWKTKQKK